MSTNSKVLALKYRPKLFSDLIGQEVVSDTIYNSIKYDKIPNAFLFTGIRGVGKTTIARLIAKALNCKNGIDNINGINRYPKKRIELNDKIKMNYITKSTKIGIRERKNKMIKNLRLLSYIQRN